MYTARCGATEAYSAADRIRFEKAAFLFEAEQRRQMRPLTVLDAGCGAGLFASLVARERFTLVGLELNLALLDAARPHYDRLIAQDVEEAWALEDGAVDGVLLAALLEHVFDYHAVLNEANRVLTPGGLLVVEVPNLGFWREVRKLLVRQQPHWAREMQHVHLWTARFLEHVLAAHGFRPEHRECDRLVPPFSQGWRSAFLERAFASWGSILIVGARKVRRAVIADHSVAHRYARTRRIDKRMVEVLEASGAGP